MRPKGKRQRREKLTLQISHQACSTDHNFYSTQRYLLLTPSLSFLYHYYYFDCFSISLIAHISLTFDVRFGDDQDQVIIQKTK